MTQDSLASSGPGPELPGPVLSTPTPQELRDRLSELVVRDLLGPTGDEPEELAGNPLDHYIIGRLAPGGVKTGNGTALRTVGKEVAPETLDEASMSPEQEPEAGDPEPSAPSTPSLHPSTLGLTVRLDRKIQELTVDCAWARYERGESEIEGNPKRVFRRVPCSGTVNVKLVEGELEARPLHVRDFPHIVVRGRARLHEDSWLVSLFLVNGQEDRPGSAHWMFQASMTVTAGLDTAPFLPRRTIEPSGGDQDERRSLAMTYRFHPEFAVGHGTGVHADAASDDPRRAVRVSTTATPTYEVPHTDVPDPQTDEDADLRELGALTLDMSELSHLEPEPLRTALLPLVDGYRSWIERQRQSVDDPAAGLDVYRAEAAENMLLAAQAADRIQAGIDLLRDDPEALTAFHFANRAMWHQRIHTIAAQNRRRTTSLTLQEAVEAADLPKNRSWRPFQLAFLLLNLPSLANPGHPERADNNDEALADLLWFPTGGGKTEAYLGLTAFTLAIRRRRPGLGGLDAEHGVAVIMRYTLRLLTIQQFQRAAALICATEVIRRDDPERWGDNPFRIGLWVGGRVTPNTTDQAVEWARDQKKDRGRGAFGRMGSPHQLTSCPWCGSKMEAGRDISVDTTLRRTFITCPDAYECPFGASAFGLRAEEQGLPVLVVDEEIYRFPPGLVIATVDKFAQMPWKGDTQALFGQVSRQCTRHGYVTPSAVDTEWESASHPPVGGHPAASTVDAVRVRPPDLIVQDELHLISGPLGSLTGLYETAVDRLSTWEPEPGRPVRPKVIASTATVRRADRQIHDLFARRTAVFPPSGLSADDTFFARRRPVDHTPGRRYVGICAQGVRTKSVAIRVFVAQLAAAQHLYETYGASELTDPYMTLVGYFNSLRDLGGMRRLVEDDVSTRLLRADRRGLATRRIGEPAELTSRMASDAIPDILEKLDITFGRRPKGAPRPIDVLLATNMIAVGVDVSRLGVMVVNNQPKSTAEYIQATSRVGRRAPGLVFTLLNWARPRDLSHYETFESFHATIYQHVEALSVTPFADRALDRGLTGVLASLVRNLRTDYNANRGAQWVDRRGEVVSHAVASLALRAEDVTRNRHIANEVRARLDTRLDYWEQKRKAPGAVLGYRAARRQGDVAPLLLEPDSGPWRLMTCPTSLREVEPPIRLILTGEAGGDLSNEPPYTPQDQSDDSTPDTGTDPWETT